jgi:hypothetical protein
MSFSDGESAVMPKADVLNNGCITRTILCGQQSPFIRLQKASLPSCSRLPKPKSDILDSDRNQDRNQDGSV